MTDASQSPPVFGRLVFSSKNPCLLALHTAATVARISLNIFSERKKIIDLQVGSVKSSSNRNPVRLDIDHHTGQG